MILETDPNVIAGKVAVHSMDPGAPLSEQVCSLSTRTRLSYYNMDNA